MIGVSNHIVFRFHYHSRKVIGSLIVMNETMIATLKWSSLQWPEHGVNALKNNGLKQWTMEQPPYISSNLDRYSHIIGSEWNHNPFPFIKVFFSPFTKTHLNRHLLSKTPDFHLRGDGPTSTAGNEAETGSESSIELIGGLQTFDTLQCSRRKPQPSQNAERYLVKRGGPINKKDPHFSNRNNGVANNKMDP